ncbi:hypothetical protein L228DRAFT_248130 [Xylona heveae TC161]|uniref:Chromatin modification-related protein n=1 Tax=Xylona heveae (strain CBS 132557 / TC161) TaxID=1328760 RepID=A0A165GPN0_XYLHT|nr:hypothetical protein L228DRAFT_248130 [Xylona heveae TC161]KZF22441.1 hypothetical protein L228DRAFT_248130 [Xylona heveae TC161]
MAHPEDAGAVLEQFIHDVANLPAEVAHLLEEIAAKDKVIQECRAVITARDNSIQKFIKLNGSLQINPKEDSYSKTIAQNFDRAQILQEEKVGLSEKAAVLLDRHIKRLDLKIRDLQNEGAMPPDPTMPSLLQPSPGNRVPPASGPSTGVSTPLHPLSINAGTSSATTVANSGMARLAQQGPTVAPSTPSATPSSAAATLLQPPQRHRESSAGAADAKRRRLNAQISNLSQTTSASGLARHASAGPGTPKAGTPGSTRAGSAGPRTTIKKSSKKVAPHQQVRKKTSTKTGLLKKPSSARKLLGANGIKASPSSTGDEESVLSEASGISDDENLSPPPGVAGSGDEEMEDVGEEEDAGDDRKYCTCRSVSYGNMVACDNDDCPYEWFHWSCVGMTKEPVGKWYCDECRSKL